VAGQGHIAEMVSGSTVGAGHVMTSIARHDDPGSVKGHRPGLSGLLR